MGDSMTCHNIAHRIIAKNGRFYGLFWKPVDFGAQTVTDGLARFHRIAQKRAILQYENASHGT